MTGRFHFLTALLFQCTLVCAQSISPEMRTRIDALFKAWDTAGSPGYAIGIVRNDSLIYAKGYGSANLEYQVPVTPATIFHMASVSKQFTAYCIVLLAKQGKLKLDDDIHPYLPWLKIKEKITIRQLLNHTSGMRDQWQLLVTSGTQMEDVISQEHIIKILAAQRALNFPPGEQNMYSNSGFTMLAEIVRSVTGQSLRQFADSAIFRPLGMHETRFHDDCAEVVPNRAYSYYVEGRPPIYRNAVLSYSNDGATSLFTNVNDMSKWLMNFYTPVVGDSNTLRELTTKGVLNNGTVLNYALGISVDQYHGWLRYSHNGADAGFRTAVAVFPDAKLGIMVFSNLGNAMPDGKAMQIADLFLPNRSPAAPAQPKAYTDSALAVIPDTTAIKKYTGDYIGEDGAHFSFRLANGKLFWMSNKNPNLLVPDVKDTFRVFDRPFIRFIFSTKGKERYADEYWMPASHRKLQQYDTTSASEERLHAYTGRYYCPELDCSYYIELRNHKLVFTHPKYDDAAITLYGNTRAQSEYWWMSNINFITDKKERITGFEINSGRVMHLWFKKEEQ